MLCTSQFCERFPQKPLLSDVKNDCYKTLFVEWTQPESIVKQSIHSPEAKLTDESVICAGKIDADNQELEIVDDRVSVDNSLQQK